MSWGRLYGVGVGPGASDLMTLRALNVIKAVPVLVLPRSSDYGASTAWRIARSVVGDNPGQERLFFTFPMNKDPERLRPAWDRAFAAIGKRLEEGLSVAFVTEGDPSLYSTFIYLQREVPRRWPAVEVEIVPGVSSLAAVPAAIGIPLADGCERIAILPATYGLDDLERVLDAFDTTVLMKIGGEMPRIVSVLEEKGLLDRATYVSKATMPEQRIVRSLRSAVGERGDCFGMVVVARKERSGMLVGAARAAVGAAKP